MAELEELVEQALSKKLPAGVILEEIKDDSNTLKRLSEYLIKRYNVSFSPGYVSAKSPVEIFTAAYLRALRKVHSPSITRR